MSIYSQVAEFAALNAFDYRVDLAFAPNEPVFIGYKISLSRGSAIAEKIVGKTEVDRCRFDLVDRILNDMNKAFIRSGL
ncbi:hypothetical protein VPHK359_0020 [Vibrio phage K359]